MTKLKLFDLTQDFVKTTSRRQAQPQLNSTSTQLKLTELGTTQLKLVSCLCCDEGQSKFANSLKAWT